MKTLQLEDSEFGIISVRCNPRARRIVLRVMPNGEVRVSIPHARHLGDAERLVHDARERIRAQREQLGADIPRYQAGMSIGQHHQLVFRAANGGDIATRINDDQIIVRYPLDMDIEDPKLQAKIHDAVKKALRREAQEILPTRVARLARQWGYSYSKLRISSGHTRWGSCSSEGTISLNLWLMDLSDELIDYVICHELCHTKQHNHSDKFWALVAAHTPNYKELRKQLKGNHPY